MKDKIKEIKIKTIGQLLDYVETEQKAKELINYITNLQEENERLKELCDKYEEEHSTTFNEWKETITDKYQTLKDLQEEKDKYKDVIDKIKEETKLAYNELQPGELVIGQALLKNILELLEEVKINDIT